MNWVSGSKIPEPQHQNFPLIDIGGHILVQLGCIFTSGPQKRCTGSASQT
jgi:hypothetical protein